MPLDRPRERSRAGAKSAWMRHVYRRVLRTPDLSDREIDEVREHVIRLAQTLCEHVWGKRFY